MLGFGKKKDDEKESAQLKQYQDSLKTLGEQFDAAKKELATAQARIKQLESDIATLKREDLSEDQKQAQMLKAAQAETQKAVQEAQTARNEASGLKEQVAQFQARIKDLEAELEQAGSAGGSPDRPAQKYTVQSGDSLRAIAQRFYGNEMEYMRIFHANRDQLNDPDLIHPGQVLNIP